MIDKFYTIGGATYTNIIDPKLKKYLIELERIINMVKVFIDEDICKGCELCTNVCPSKILELANDKINSKGYSPAICIDQDKCISCTFCAMICPDMAITINGVQ